MIYRSSSKDTDVLDEPGHYGSNLMQHDFFDELSDPLQFNTLQEEAPNQQGPGRQL
jgi:hypothetical protein